VQLKRRRMPRAPGRFGLAVAWLAAVCGLVQPAGAGDGAASMSAGERLYQDHCAACHGENLEGEPDWMTPMADGTLPAPPHDNSGHTWHHPDDVLFDYTKLGGKEAMRRMGIEIERSGMPGFGDVLSDAEIRAVLDYIKSTWSDANRRYQEERSRR